MVSVILGAITNNMIKLLQRIPLNFSAPERKRIEVNPYKWNLVLRGFLDSNVPKKALVAYALMRRRRVKVDGFTLLFVIKACGLFMHNILVGKQVHAHATKLGFQTELVIQTSLLQMYGMFGDIDAADKLFDETSHRDVVQWNALLALYSQSNQPWRTIKAARWMISEAVRPNEVTVVSIVSSCSQLKALAEGKQLHCYAIKCLAVLDTFVHNALINMYAKCGCVSDAQMVFQNLRNRNEVSWASMINAYGDNGYLNEALTFFRKMEALGGEADEVTMLSMVSICAKFGRPDLGEWIDEHIERCRFHRNMHISNALIHMHSRCGNIDKSCKIFGQMRRRNLITWTAMIQVLAMHGHGQAALTYFSQMQTEGFRPDEVCLLSMINACSHFGLVEEGKHFFRWMVEEQGMRPWMEHYGSMVDLLCRAELVNDAFAFVVSMPLKPDIIIWRTLIGACRDQGNINLARQAVDYITDSEPVDSGNLILKSNLYAMIGDWDSVQEVRSYMRCMEVAKQQPACSYIESTAI